jgi:uncharacterized protein YukE
MAVQGPSVATVPGVEELLKYGGEAVRNLIHELGNMEGNRTRMLEVSRTWTDASGNAAAANRSFADDVNAIQHWQAAAAEAFKNNYTQMIGKFGQLEPAYKTLGDALKSVADNLAKVNETVITATITAIGAIIAAVGAAFVTFGASAVAIPVIVGGWLAFGGSVIVLLTKFFGDLVNLLNELRIAGQFVGVRPASPINFDGQQVQVPPVEQWHHKK